MIRTNQLIVAKSSKNKSKDKSKEKQTKFHKILAEINKMKKLLLSKPFTYFASILIFKSNNKTTITILKITMPRI